MPITPEAQLEACKALIKSHTATLLKIFSLDIIVNAQESHLIELEAELEAQENAASAQEELNL